MFSLFVISFIAGVLTVLAPCVLPVLPIIIGGSLSTAEEARPWRPYIITGTLAISIVLFTLLLKVSTLFITVPPKTWSIVSGLLLMGLGSAMMFPSVWDRLSVQLGLGQASEGALMKSTKKTGVLRDVLVGVTLGPVFASCSPTYFLILATVLPQSLVNGIFALLAYAVGLSSVLLLVALFGQVIVSRMRFAADPRGWFKRGLGILFVCVGIAIIFGIDKDVATYVLDTGYFDVTRIEGHFLSILE